MNAHAQPPSLIHFSDPLPAAVIDAPAAERCLGPAPQRATQECYSALAGALSIGEWSCAPGAWRITFHAGRHEFFQVLEGCIEIADESGQIRCFGPGEAGIIPAGFRGIFTVRTPVRKRYVMLDAPA